MLGLLNAESVPAQCLQAQPTPASGTVQCDVKPFAFPFRVEGPSEHPCLRETHLSPQVLLTQCKSVLQRRAGSSTPDPPA